MARASLALALLLAGSQLAMASYDETIAANAVYYASAAYCPPNQVGSWSGMSSTCSSKTSGFSIKNTYSISPDDDEISQKNHAFGYVGVDSSRGWVVGAFKGTNQTADFATDISGGLRLFGSCEIEGNDMGRVHKGFCNYYKGIAEAGFAEAFSDALKANPSYTPIIIGHSLGGAAAVLAAMDVYAQYQIQAVVYTYGQPRVGNYDFSQAFASSVSEAYRVVHSSDMVAHLPMCCGIVGGCRKSKDCPYHTTDEIWYNNGMDLAAGDTYQTCDGGEDSSCENMISLSIPDHLTYFGVDIGQDCCFGN